MKWIKMKLMTTTAAEDLICDMLSELGIDGIEIEDNVPLSEEDKKRMFIDILPELDADEGEAKISFYADMDEDLDSLKERINAGLQELSSFVDVGKCTLEISETEDKDWINNWKEFFKPFRVDDQIVIKPTWEKLDENKEGDIVIEIDPGTAFGTGSHETTKLCILNLKKYMKKGGSVLDVGCGSGILSIISRKLGAGYVKGTDIDPIAVGVSGENAEVNHISAFVMENEPGKDAGEDAKSDEAALNGISFFRSNVLESVENGGADIRKAVGRYDIVVANILADVIIPLSYVVSELLNPDGIFISSGIINTKAEAVKEAMLANGFEIIDTLTMGDWVSYVSLLRRK